MFNSSLLLIFALTVVSAFSRENYLVNQILLQPKCQKSSPIHSIKYGYDTVSNMGKALFCEQQGFRTCCNPGNLRELEFKWLRTFAGTELSTACHEALSTLFCYDCDGDVGQGIRQGLCPTTCSQLFGACRFDMFSYDLAHPDRVVPCKKDTLFCSKLHDMISESEGFCRSLGYKVNEKTEIDHDYLLNLALNNSIEPICYNMVAASSISGRGPTVAHSKDSTILAKNSYLAEIILICLMVLLV